MIEFDIFDHMHLWSTIWEPQTHCANLKKHFVFPRISNFKWKFLPCPQSSEIVGFAQIRLATGTSSSIEMWRKGQDQRFLHLLAFLAVTAIQIWSNFVVGYISKLLPNIITSFVAQWSRHLPVETLMVTGSNPSLAKKYFLQKKI